MKILPDAWTRRHPPRPPRRRRTPLEISPAPFDPRIARDARYGVSPGASAFDGGGSAARASSAARFGTQRRVGSHAAPGLGTRANGARVRGWGRGRGRGRGWGSSSRIFVRDALVRRRETAIPGAPPRPSSRRVPSAPAPLRPASGLASSGAPGIEAARTPADPPRGGTRRFGRRRSASRRGGIRTGVRPRHRGARRTAPPGKSAACPDTAAARDATRALALTAARDPSAPEPSVPSGSRAKANSSFLRRGAKAKAYPPDPRAMAPRRRRTARRSVSSSAGILRGGEDRIVGGDAHAARGAGTRADTRGRGRGCSSATDRRRIGFTRACRRRGRQAPAAAGAANDGRNPPGESL